MFLQLQSHPNLRLFIRTVSVSTVTASPFACLGTRSHKSRHNFVDKVLI